MNTQRLTRPLLPFTRTECCCDCKCGHELNHKVNEFNRYLDNVRHYLPKLDAIELIQKRWFEAYYNPDFLICRKRLKRQFNDLCTEFRVSTSVETQGIGHG